MALNAGIALIIDVAPTLGSELLPESSIQSVKNAVRRPPIGFRCNGCRQGLDMRERGSPRLSVSGSRALFRTLRQRWRFTVTNPSFKAHMKPRYKDNRPVLSMAENHNCISQWFLGSAVPANKEMELSFETRIA